MPAYLLHHTHTRASNDADRRIRGHTAGNHQADYLGLVSKLPAGVDVVVTRTEHWYTTGDLYDDLAAAVRARGGRFERHAAHVCLELDGSRAAVVHGVEASVETDDQHVTICGLPLEDDGVYRGLSPEDVATAGQDAAWVAPAHPFVPRLGYEQSVLREVVTAATARDVPVALGYTVGYAPLLNALARGECDPRREDTVVSLAERLGVGLVPEVDWHVALPGTLGRMRPLPDGVFDALERGEIPAVDCFWAPAVPPTATALTYPEFARSYPELFPGAHTALGRRLLPDSEAAFRALVDASLDRVAAGFR
jgi:hypothetical protein